MDETGTRKLAVITGATGGIGFSFAKRLATAGYDLFITGRNRQRLDETALRLREGHPSTNIETCTADLAAAADIHRLAEQVTRAGRVDMLVNCAGYSENCPFCNETENEVLDMLSVHINAVVQLTHAVLPLMLEQRRGEIITVSSLAAFAPAPGASIYSSSKAFLKSFMESLHMEVRHYGVRVQSLCPGPTRTGFHRDRAVAQSVSGIDLWMEADDVVENSLKALGRGEVICVPGGANKLARNLSSLLPRRPYYLLAEKMARRFRQEDMHGAITLSGDPLR